MHAAGPNRSVRHPDGSCRVSCRFLAGIACPAWGAWATSPSWGSGVHMPRGRLGALRRRKVRFRASPRQAAPRRPHPSRRPPQPRPGRPQAATARHQCFNGAALTTPMFQRCCPDRTDGPRAQHRSAHKPTVASMASRRAGWVPAQQACSPLRGRGHRQSREGVEHDRVCSPVILGCQSQGLVRWTNPGPHACIERGTGPARVRRVLRGGLE